MLESLSNIIIPARCDYLVERAAEVFSEEVYSKTGFRPSIQRGSLHNTSYILMGDEASLAREFSDILNELSEKLEQPGEEGYRILRKSSTNETIVVCGRDPRGCFFGMGKLLRKMEYFQNGFGWPKSFVSHMSTPRYPLRGHQIGYRDDNNTYDAWTFPQFHRYIRELAVFGCNAVELFPPMLATLPYSPHYRYLPDELMIGLSRIIKSYGMDVWMWYPNSLDNCETEDGILANMNERDRVFSVIPYLDAVLMPGGDPGDLSVHDLFAIGSRTKASLIKYHPHATIWISPQIDIMEQKWLDDFFDEVNKEPEWLDGLCYGPWVKYDLKKMRKLIPQRYPIRNYPDITHSIKSQYPVPNWDGTYGMSYGREGINPRPVQFKHIHNLYEEYTIGSLTYSDGVHDDINKFLWTDQDWDPDMSAEECVEDYVRYFITNRYSKEITDAIFMLEQNWLYPIDSIKPLHTHRLWEQLDYLLNEQEKNNWRYQMLRLRAYMDLYLNYRYADEQEDQRMAIEALRSAEDIGYVEAIETAWKALDRPRRLPTREDLKHEIQRLADMLFKDIGIQLNVRHYRGAYWTRGAFLENLDIPLNDYRWLTWHMKQALKEETVEARRSWIEQALWVIDPIDCEVYIDFGSQESLKYLVMPNTWEQDPGFLSTPHLYNVLAIGSNPYVDYYDTYKERPMPLSWIRSVRSYYSTPIRVRIPNLDPAARYLLHITYYTLQKELRYRLCTGQGTVLHDKVSNTGLYENPIRTYELPTDDYKDGTLELQWDHPKRYDFIQVQELRLTRAESRLNQCIHRLTIDHKNDQK